MKFLKINVKVLLILCLFSGILFLNTGCGGKKNNTDDNNESEVNNNGNTNGGESNSSTDDNKTDDNSNSKISLDSDTDYSVWVANTTINTSKSEKSYKVIWGDTLWLISTAWEVPYQEIATYNNILNPDLIYVNQIIYNPTFK